MPMCLQFNEFEKRYLYRLIKNTEIVKKLLKLIVAVCGCCFCYLAFEWIAGEKKNMICGLPRGTSQLKQRSECPTLREEEKLLDMKIGKQNPSNRFVVLKCGYSKNRMFQIDVLFSHTFQSKSKLESPPTLNYSLQVHTHFSSHIVSLTFNNSQKKIISETPSPSYTSILHFRW